MGCACYITKRNFNMMSRRYLFKSILYLHVLLFSANLPAQDNSFPFPPFEKLTTRQGLSDNEVYQVTQDKMGFIWILTNNGLNRYDGYSFKTYDYNPHDSNSITAGFFYSLEQDPKGLLWMNSETNGIYSFNPVTGLFYNYRNVPKNKNSLADDQTTQLVVDKKGNIWIGTMSGLDKLEPATKQFTHFTCLETKDAGISNNKVYSISIDEDDNLWLVTGSPGIDYFNTKTGKLIRHFDFGSSDNPEDDWQNHLYEVCAGKNGNMWIGSKDHGLYCYNTRTGNIMNFQHKKDDPYSISDNGVYKTLEDHLGNLWLATDAGTIDFYEKSTAKFYHRTVSAIGQTDIIEDQSHKIWIATMNGIYACDTRFKKINSILLDVNNYSYNDQSPYYFFRTSNGTMYVSYLGVRRFDVSTKTLTPFEIIINGKNIFENNITWQIYEDRKGNLWFATIRGLLFYDVLKKQYKWYEHKEGDNTSLSAYPCTGILEDSKGRYWVTTWGGGFDSFDPVKGKFKAFKAHGGFNSISTNSLGGIFEDSKGIIYIGSLGGGILQFDPDKETITTFRHNVQDSSSISCDIAMTFMESKSGTIWICTLGGGINAFDPVTKKFRSFTTKEGLCSNSVVSIVEGDNGNYWLGTLKGFSCFSPPEDPFNPGSKFSFRNYDISDGLPDNKMSLHAAYKDIDGKIYFGSTDEGIIYFAPAQLKDNDFLPPVYITDLKLFNTSIRPFDKDSILKGPLELTKQVILSYDQNDLSLEFAALNYVHPEKNQYKYKLENYNKDWIMTDAGKRFANYTNLNPGKYVFKVRAGNNDGLWSRQEASLIIIITPPFWQTWWFKTLIALAAAGIVYGIYRYRLKQVLRLQNIRNRIAADLHDDIGSTLNSISVYSEVAKNDPEQRNFSLSMIGESSRKVIDAMSDIVWTINPDNDSFEKVILRMRSLAYNLMRAKNIEFTFKTDESLNHLKLSLEKRRNFFLIFKETLNNLIKHSQAKRVQISIIQKSGTVTFLVRDDGTGFDTSIKYNGNGLTNIRKRAKEMNAQLHIESGEGIGTSTELIFTP
jgi:ligand-binding sensor domain-containing protein/two-component sensor histidine kinase